MSIIICKCVDDIFNGYDYNNLPIKYNILKNHNSKDNAWVSIDKDVYSIQKDDELLLNIFKNYYGKDVKKYLEDNKLFKNLKEKILIMEKLKIRKIGYLIY